VSLLRRLFGWLLPARGGAAAEPARADELSRCRRLLSQSLDANRFSDAVRRQGFKFARRGASGELHFQGQRGTLVLFVMASHHPRDIYGLRYDVPGRAPQWLVREGRLVG